MYQSFLELTSAMNEISTPSFESIQYDSAPPLYSTNTTVPLSNVPAVSPTDQPWDEFPPPPAYDSLPDLPIWSISLTVPTANTLSSVQQWNVHSTTSTSVLHQSSTNGFSEATATLRKRKFQRWKQAYVAVLLFVGAFAQVGAGTVLASNAFSQLSNTLLYGIPFWAPVCYIITGSLLLSAYVDPTPRRVRLSLFFDIITTIFSIVGLVFNVKDLEKLQSDPFADSQGSVYNIHYVLICTNVVILCFAVFATTFGFYVLCCVRREEPQLSVIENTFVTSMLPPDFPETPPFPPPPPYTSQGAFKGSTTI